MINAKQMYLTGTDVKPGGPLGVFRKELVNAGTGFPFTLAHLICITHILHHSATHTNSHPRDLLQSSVTHPAMWPAEVVQILKMGHCLAPSFV